VRQYWQAPQHIPTPGHAKLLRILSLLKLLGILLSGIFGILGLLTEYKDKETGKTTPWGKLALAGISIATIFALAVECLESRKSTHEAQDARLIARFQSKRSNEILADVRRSLDPLTNVRVSYAFKFPMNVPQFFRYRSRLKNAIDDMLAMPDRSLHKNHIYFKPGPAGERSETVIIPRDSLLNPQPKDGLPYFIVSAPQLRFDFYSDGIAWSPGGDIRTVPDLSFSLKSTAAKDEQGAASYSVQYDVAKQELSLEVMGALVSPLSWYGSGKIRSFSDLKSTYLIVRLAWPLREHLRKENVSHDPESEAFDRVVSRVHLDHMELHFNTRHCALALLHTSDFRQSPGEAIYRMKFPDDMDKL
jgi:hypothetical protein